MTAWKTSANLGSSFRGPLLGSGDWRFRVCRLGFRGLGFRGLGFRGLGFRVRGLGFRGASARFMGVFMLYYYFRGFRRAR